MSQEAATAAEEEYLQTIYWLEEAGLPITAANIARAMQLSAPTVHEMVGRLEGDGYVTRAADKSPHRRSSSLRGRPSRLQADPFPRNDPLTGITTPAHPACCPTQDALRGEALAAIRRIWAVSG